MSFLSAFNICASGLTAQRKRLDVASENIANIETTRTESGNPYRRKMVVLEEIGDNTSFRSHLARASRLQKGNQGGVRVAEIVEDQRDLVPVYLPYSWYCYSRCLCPPAAAARTRTPPPEETTGSTQTRTAMFRCPMWTG